MKTANLLNVLMAIAIVVLSIRLIMLATTEKPTETVNHSEAVINNIMTRTSIRDYTSEGVEEEKVETLLRAAMAAPTAGNKQPWVFVVIKDKAIQDSISANFKPAKMVRKAPLAIVVCGDLNKTFPGDGVTYWVQDTSAATENMLLAAHSLNLGAVWCGVYPIPSRVDYLKKLLDLPDNLVPLNVVAIGYPAENPAPKDKWKPENIIYRN